MGLKGLMRFIVGENGPSKDLGLHCVPVWDGLPI